MAKRDSPKPQTKTRLVQVLFTTSANGAKEVVVTGDFTNWSKDGIRLRPGEAGEWSGVLELPPGHYRYRLLVDGEWRDHPEAESRVPNAFGSQDCCLVVSPTDPGKLPINGT